jgi:hypothetical protein
MAAGVTDHIFELGEFLAAIEDAAPCEKPEKQPLKARTPEGPARALPEGRGFLRLVGGTGGAANAQAPAPEPVEPPPAPVAAQVEAAPATGEQLDLLSWRPRKGEQLSLF